MEPPNNEHHWVGHFFSLFRGFLYREVFLILIFGYGLEIPCIYRFYGPEPYVKKFREVLQALNANGLL